MANIVYQITHKKSGKSYIGQTRQPFYRRIRRHCTDSGKCRLIARAIRKYGIESFHIDVVYTAKDLTELNLKEQEFIKDRNTLSPNGYNLHSGGASYSISEETRNKLRESHKGIAVSKGTRNKLSTANKGKFRTTEQKLNYKNSWTKERRDNHHAKGENHPGARLTQNQVIEIKLLLRNNTKVKDVAKKYEVNFQTIYKIRSGTHWKNVQI